MHYNGEDRRRHKRIRISLVVVYREDEPLDVRIRAGHQERQATMIDMSEEGISVLTESSIAIGTMLSIRFSLADESRQGVDFYGSVEVSGKVLYATPSATGHHRLGIQFCNLSHSDRVQIINFVEIIEKRYTSGS